MTSSFKVECRFHKTITFTVEAESEEALYEILDNEDFDPEMLYKVENFEDWHGVNPIEVTLLPDGIRGDHEIGYPRIGKGLIAPFKTFLVQSEEEPKK